MPRDIPTPRYPLPVSFLYTGRQGLQEASQPEIGIGCEPFSLVRCGVREQEATSGALCCGSTETSWQSRDMSKSGEIGRNVESQRRWKGRVFLVGVGVGISMDKGLEAGLNEPSDFLTETLSSMSLFPRPLHRPPDNLCSSQPVFFINSHSEPWASGSEWVLAGSWAEPGKCWLAELGVAGRDGPEGKHIPRAGC